MKTNMYDYICETPDVLTYIINNRKEIVNLEKKYSGYIPTELIALLVLSIIMILVGKFI